MPNCKFPASKWRQVRRNLAEIADLTEDGNIVHWCMQTVLDIDRMRWNHEDSCPECNAITIAAFERRMQEASHDRH